MNSKKKTIQPVTAILAIGLAVVIYGVGYLHGHANVVFERNHPPKLVNRELKKPDSVDFSLFWDAYQKIESDYVSPVDDQKALEGSIKGLVASLGDPFSTYLTKDESKEFMKDLNGQFEGIGAELTIKDDVLTVVSPLNGSPADQAGLKPKDQIVSIDGTSTQGIDLAEAVSKIRGQSGSKVTLGVLSSGQKEPRTLEITRRSIKADSVTMTRRDDGVAVIRISQFSDDTSSLMDKYAKELTATKPKGIVLDLRNDPGGLLDASIDVTSLFIDKGVVVIEKDRDGTKTEEKTTKDPILKDIPLTVLINEGSASASEIVSGAIQDTKRGTIIGKKSFGKGSVQNLIDLNDGSTLRLTIAQWLTPNGRTISHEGIKPDIESEDDPKTDQDEVIEKAVSQMNISK